MAKIKKLKENGSTIYPATIPEGVVDTNGFTLAELLDELLEVLAGGSRGNMELAFSDLRAAIGSEDGNDLSRFVAKVNAFLEDADASDATINRWKEIESFLAGITDTETLTGLLAENLQSAKGYADTKVSSGTANMVTMSANAGAADRVLTSGGSNKTAKDSGVAIGDLAKKDLSNVELATLIDKGVGMLSVHEYTLSGDSISNLSSFMGGISADEQVYLAKDSGGNGLSPIIVVEDPSTGSVACMFVASNRRLYYVYADDDTGSYVSKSTFIGDAASTAVDGLMSAADKAKLDGIAAGANKYTLPAATASALGGVKSGEDVEVDSSGIITVHFAEKASEADCDENGDKIVDTYARFDELPVVATASKAGLVKSGGNITVASDGTVTVNKAKEAATASVATNALHATSADSSDTATTAENAVNALNDSNGVSIHTTYLKAAAVTDVTEYKEITI